MLVKGKGLKGETLNADYFLGDKRSIGMKALTFTFHPSAFHLF